MMPLQIIQQIFVGNMLKKDSRFQYFVKENGGLSASRNYGIRQSKGSYLTFIDSDDWIDSSYLETLYELIIKHKADVSIACYGAYDKERATYLFYAYGDEYEKVYSGREVVEQFPIFEVEI
ncbi:glycosyl transferase family protein [Streptococcus pneumoniae]|nr:glycosyl transferase family protein [Streptococcus pneumoniae]CZE06908.1 glycosyl transferase family protein [Streptococcus pneumoniae]VFI20460.1 glycosyl transferase family protein [Streptococcus pneumoniae]VIV14782.1 glycosyl transferase family protein [Streptococcus pneumoniae]VKA42441.1 glycosyl transferase family protein [Streptococcus pneumoniae]